MAQLGNCPRCRKLYLRIRDVCDECFQKQEDDFLKVVAYLREYPGNTIQEVSEATNVTVAQIRHYILTGRIIAGNFPNLSYSCEICGTSIRSGKTCQNCIKTIYKQTNSTDKAEGEDNHDRSGKSGGYIKNYL